MDNTDKYSYDLNNEKFYIMKEEILGQSNRLTLGSLYLYSVELKIIVIITNRDGGGVRSGCHHH